MKSKFYAIKTITGKIEVKPLKGKKDQQAIEQAYASDKIADVITDIQANNIQKARKLAERELNYV